MRSFQAILPYNLLSDFRLYLKQTNEKIPPLHLSYVLWIHVKISLFVDSRFAKSMGIYNCLHQKMHYANAKVQCINAHKLHRRLIIYLINWFWLNNERGHEELYNYAKERYGRVDMLWSNYYEVCLRAQTQTLS